MRLFFQPNIQDGALYLDPEESRHCIKVLRLKEQDQIIVIDGHGGKHTVVISEANHKKCTFSIVSSEQELKPKYHIHVAIAPTKNVDRIEWFVEKAVEIGIQEISFILCDNSERKHFKTDRIIKKAVSAMKQSLKSYLPRINEPLKLSNFINNTIATERFIAYVDQDKQDLLFDHATPRQNTLILVGPEGDFSTNELDLALSKGYKKIGLGESRLRTETAGLAVTHILNLVNQKQKRS